MIRVLHADDDPQVAAIVRLLFEQNGKDFVLEQVASGHACLAALEAGSYDLVLLDLAMPDLDGMQVLGELSARADATPVVIVSAQGQNELAVRALRAGAVDCVDKNSADFRNIPEFARRVMSRHRRRVITAIPRRSHRVVLIDPDPQTRATISRFLTDSSSLLLPTGIDAAALDTVLGASEPPDAVIIGPGNSDHTVLDTLRKLRSRPGLVVTLVLSSSPSSEMAVAAFQLGARDFLHYRDGCLPDLVFSLNNGLKQREIERVNERLSAELAEFNVSLAQQVADRTRELETQVSVREAAERRSEEHAARLQALSMRLLRVQEEERHAIARELHDQVGQLLTGLRFRLEASRSEPTALNEALVVTDELMRTVRELTLQLRPRMLDDLGLQPAVEWHVGQFQQQTGIAVELDIAMPQEPIPALLATTVYRVVQEALTNVARHSGATNATVTIAGDGQLLHVEISDRGRGFDPDVALKKHDSLGLAGLAERVNLAGGTFELFSRHGEGTRLHAEFALRTETALSPPVTPAHDLP